MNKKISDLLASTGGALGFALFGGLAYFFIGMGFIFSKSAHGGLLLLMVGPLILFGTALILIKLVKQNTEADNNAANLRLFYMHVILFLISIAFAAGAVL